MCQAAPPSDSRLGESTIGMESYKRFAEVFGLTSRWPSAVVYNRSGRCVFRGDLDRSWDSIRFALHAERTETQPGCDLIVSAEMGGDQPATSNRAVIQLYLLDAPFCSECTRIENEVRKLVTEEPDRWQVMLTRVNLTETHNPVVNDSTCATCEDPAGSD